jgi:hypothetical protein
LSTKELSREEEFKDPDLPPQLIETQQQLMRSAVEQSEREYLEKAIEDSIKSAAHQGEDDMEATETLLLDTAYQASLSAQETHGMRSGDQETSHLNIPNPSASMDSDLKLALELSQLNEEEIMQRVLNESLAHQPSNTFSRAPPSSSLTASLREEEEMQEAIRMSMMNQYATSTTPAATTSVPHHREHHSQYNERLYHNVDLGDDPELELAIQESFRDLRK